MVSWLGKKHGVPSFLGVKPPVSFLRARMVVVILALVFVWAGVVAGREWVRRSQIESEISRVQEEIAQIETTSKELEETLKIFTQPETIEREARRRLNLARSGETVVLIPDSEEDDRFSLEGLVSGRNVALVVTQQGTGPLTNLVAWWGYFFSEKFNE